MLAATCLPRYFIEGGIKAISATNPYPCTLRSMSTLVFKDPTPSETNPPPSITTSTAIIYSIYDPNSIPPKPSEGNWTRFVCLSDIHQHVFPVPDGDVLLHSGDLTGTGTLRGFKITMDWLCGLTHPLKMWASARAFFAVLIVLHTASLQVTTTLLCMNRGMKPASTDGIRAKRFDSYRHARCAILIP